MKKQLLLWQQVFFQKGLFLWGNRAEKIKIKLEILEIEKNKKIDEEVDKLLKKIERSERFKSIVKKNYLVWKNAYRKKLIREIGCCEKCSRKNVILTIDHIIPKAFLKSLGIKAEQDRNEDNFQLLCELCNHKKGSYFDFTDPRTYFLLRYYTDKLPKTRNPFKERQKRKIEQEKKQQVIFLEEQEKKEQEYKEKIEAALKGTPNDPDFW